MTNPKDLFRISGNMPKELCLTTSSSKESNPIKRIKSEALI
jgi:hypothetical protein